VTRQWFLASAINLTKNLNYELLMMFTLAAIKSSLSFLICITFPFLVVACIKAYNAVLTRINSSSIIMIYIEYVLCKCTKTLGKWWKNVKTGLCGLFYAKLPCLNVGLSLSISGKHIAGLFVCFWISQQNSLDNLYFYTKEFWSLV